MSENIKMKTEVHSFFFSFFGETSRNKGSRLYSGGVMNLDPPSISDFHTEYFIHAAIVSINHVKNKDIFFLPKRNI